MEQMTMTIDGGHRGGGLTRADLEALAARDDGLRYELLDGVVLVTPSPSRDHQSMSSGLFRLLDGLPPQFCTRYAPLDVDLAIDTILQPDLVVMDRDEFADAAQAIRPLLVVEILSPSTRRIDQVLKRERYQQARVPSYWIADPQLLTVLALELDGDTYREVGLATPDSPLTLTRPAPLTLHPQPAWLTR